jgi:bifunctional DNA-binding transcriptional regulator/antitoxin component of YhaV-PrlF toxin-antitoxin module
MMGQKGRVVIPHRARERHGWDEGTALVGFDTDGGFMLMSREAARRMVRDGLAGPSLADELIAERHAEADRDRGAL